jgi:hypothetical protein
MERLKERKQVDCHCTLACIQSTPECRPKSQPFPTVALTLSHSPPTMTILVSDIGQLSSVIQLQVFQENRVTQISLKPAFTPGSSSDGDGDVVPHLGDRPRGQSFENFSAACQIFHNHRPRALTSHDTHEAFSLR